MEDITLIPIEVLTKDREESIKDIHNCRAALIFGVKIYSGGLVAHRLEANQMIVEKIEEELKRRRAKG